MNFKNKRYATKGIVENVPLTSYHGIVIMSIIVIKFIMNLLVDGLSNTFLTNFFFKDFFENIKKLLFCVKILL